HQTLPKREQQAHSRAKCDYIRLRCSESEWISKILRCHTNFMLDGNDRRPKILSKSFRIFKTRKCRLSGTCAFMHVMRVRSYGSQPRRHHFANLRPRGHLHAVEVPCSDLTADYEKQKRYLFFLEHRESIPVLTHVCIIKRHQYTLGRRRAFAFD